MLGSIWTIKVLGWTSVIVLAVSRRFRHLLVAVVSLQVVSILAIALSVVVRRPRAFGVAAEGNWAGWAMPSRPVALLAGILVGMLYSLVPEGRWGRPASGSPPGWSRCWPWRACTWASTPQAMCWSGRRSV
jgi:hypothetical protein